MLARTVRRADGTLVAVGEDLRRSEEVREALFAAILRAGAIALILGLLASIVATRRVLRRMEEIVATIREVEKGDLSARVVRTERANDDVDELALAINRMLDRIDSLMSAMRRVSAEIAHDMRTPLTHARHALYAARWSDSEAERLDAIDAAGESMDQALRLFEAMLALAEIDSGTARAGFAPVDLVAIAEQAVDAYRADIEASGRSILWCGDGVREVLGDADLLTRALANLIDNALKHSRQGASIDVRIVDGADRVSVVVSDDGPGVDPGDEETMLRPFGRLDPARSTAGNGLGLAIVNAIATLHGGGVAINYLKPGLSISIELPSLKLAPTPSPPIQ